MAARKKSTRKSAKASGAKLEKITSARTSRHRAGTGSASSSQRKRSVKPKISSRKKVSVKRAGRPAAPKRKKKTGGAAVSRVSRTTKKRVARGAKSRAAVKSPAKASKDTRRPARENVAAKSSNKQAEPKLQPKTATGGRPEGVGASSTPAKAAKAGSPGVVSAPAAAVAATAKAMPQPGRDLAGKDQKIVPQKDQKIVPQEVASAAAKASKPTGQRQGFKVNEFVVYPAHGVGQIVSIEEQEVAGFKLELFVISFSKDKMTLRVPTSKVTAVGMRKISDPEAARRSLEILTGRARIKRTMWSRRAQEYETKINSGDINAIAEVVRDLYRSDAQPEQSYSERQLYEAALDRMVREIAAVQKSNEIDALKAVEAQLQKSQGRTKALSAPQGEAKDPEIEEAA
jgi:CarD family transcriptional regulator